MRQEKVHIELTGLVVKEKRAVDEYWDDKLTRVSGAEKIDVVRGEMTDSF